MKDADLI